MPTHEDLARQPDPTIEFATLLRSIDATLKELLVLSKSKRAATAAPSNIASDADLDSEHGDEVLKAKMPKDWTGADMKGARMSECPPELLDLLAKRSDYFAEQNDAKGEKQKAGYDRRSAMRARGWAARKRAGWAPPAVDPQWQGGEPEQW